MQKADHGANRTTLLSRAAEHQVEATVVARGWSADAEGYSFTVLVRPATRSHSEPDDKGMPAGRPAKEGPTPKLKAREVAYGETHYLALDADGGVLSAGAGWHGQLGHGDQADRESPTRIGGLAQVRAVQLAAGGAHSLVLSSAGHVYSFGCGLDGRLGHGDNRGNVMLPQRVTALLGTRICQVSAGHRHSLAVGEGGELYAWGFSGLGQLGLGETRNDQLLPTRVELPAGARVRQATHGRGRRSGPPVRTAAAGQYHSVALTEAGEVLTFGWNAHGQLGHGDQEERLVPTVVASLATSEAVAVAAGAFHTTVWLADGQCITFGRNEEGDEEGHEEGAPRHSRHRHRRGGRRGSGSRGGRTGADDAAADAGPHDRVGAVLEEAAAAAGGAVARLRALLLSRVGGGAGPEPEPERQVQEETKETD